MTSSARAGRRRRMLQEGASAAAPSASPETPPATRARYTPRDDSASFAVAKGVAPRRPMALVGVLAGLGVVTGLLAWADQFGVKLAAAGVHTAAARLLLIDQPGSLAAWWEAILWAAVATQSFLLFGLRRHRTDDTGGAYRWWLAMAGVSVGMSLGAATTTPQVVATQLASLTGFSPLAGDAFWWFAPSCLLLLGFGVRSLLEIRECPLAGAAGGLAGGLVAFGWAVSAGVIPVWLVGGSPLVAPVATLGGVSLVSFSLLLYARRIVRETLGELQRPKPAAAPAEAAADESVEEQPAPAPQPKLAKATTRREPEPVLEEEEPKVESPTLYAESDEYEEERPARRSKRQRASQRKEQQPKAAETQWVSGPEADDDYEDGPQRRKLSKAERKRLRREKARRAA